MALIFPGMDPYLEDPRFWQGVHGSLVVYLRDILQPKLRPRYVASIEERVYVEGPDRHVRPDVLVRQPRPRREQAGGVATLEADAPVIVVAPEQTHERYVSILDLRAGQRVVTVIEVVSPTNKSAGPGRDSYRSKQEAILSSDVHLVEIDLLRGGPHVLAVPEALARDFGDYDYLTCVNRAEGGRGRYELYPTRLADRLPRIRIPLADDDPDVALDVQAAVAQVYEAGLYRELIDYGRPCKPPLQGDDRAWAENLIRAAAEV